MRDRAREHHDVPHRGVTVGQTAEVSRTLSLLVAEIALKSIFTPFWIYYIQSFDEYEEISTGERDKRWMLA